MRGASSDGGGPRAAAFTLDAERPCVVVGGPGTGKSALIAAWLDTLAPRRYRVVRVDAHGVTSERALVGRLRGALASDPPDREVPLVEAALEVSKRARAEGPWVVWIDGAREQGAEAALRFADQVVARAKGTVTFVVEVPSVTLAAPALLSDERAKVVVLDDSSVADRLGACDVAREAPPPLLFAIARACRVDEPARSPFEVVAEAASRAALRPLSVVDFVRVLETDFDPAPISEPLSPEAARCAAALRLAERAAFEEPRTIASIAVVADLDEVRTRAALEQLQRAGRCRERPGGDWWSTSGREGRYAAEREAIAIPDDEASERIGRTIAMVAERAACRAASGIGGRPWRAVYGDGHRAHDEILPCGTISATARAPVPPLIFDFRHVDEPRRAPAAWSRRSANADLDGRVVWVAGLDHRRVLDVAADIARTQHHIRRALPVLRPPGVHLAALVAREHRITERAERILEALVCETFAAGAIYHRGRRVECSELGEGFDAVFARAATLSDGGLREGPSA